MSVPDYFVSLLRVYQFNIVKMYLIVFKKLYINVVIILGAPGILKRRNAHLNDRIV